MDKTLGFIGLGNMGGALLQSILDKQANFFEKIYIFDIISEKIHNYNKYSQVILCSSIKDVILNSSNVVLAVKPQSMKKILEEISKYPIEKKSFITIAAGLSISFYRQILDNKCFISRIMPNTPYLVGEGCAAICFDPNLPVNAAEIIKIIFESSGKTIVCEEKMLDAVTGLSGSGPAYMFVILEALADGGVKMGIPREQAYILAGQTMLGAAKMLLESKKQPGQLKDMVTSPGGTTIEGLSVIESKGLRGILIEAVEAATKKSQFLSNQK